MRLLLALFPVVAFAAPPLHSVFDFDCATSEAFAAGHLAPLVGEAMSAEPAEAGRSFADRAVEADLNSDGAPEFLVPLWCSPTGNCRWAVFGGKPTRAFGQVDASIIRIKASSGRESVILAYEHMSAADGMITTHVLHGGNLVVQSTASISASEAMGRLGCDGNKVPCCK
jgi:hypothetical protein